MESTEQLVNASQSGLTPRQIIQSYSDKEWERFIVEWTDGFSSLYHQVVHLGGAGDKGRDVVGYADDPKAPTCAWDNYQCKHYDHPLAPTDIYFELGKLCFYTQRGDYTIPRRYYFVAPRDVGTKLHDMLKKPDVLRCALIDNWEKYCAKGICEQEVSLSATLKEYIQTFDFSIVWFKTVQEVLAQHQKTQHWYLRFKAQRPIRPDGLPPPDGIQPHEMAYTARLLEAYSDHLKIKMKSPEDLGTTPELYEHFKRSRGYFFSAEALARFSRDYYEAGAFDLVKQHIYDGVADLTLEPHRDGYACVLAVTKASATLPLPESNEIVPHVGPADKKGVCHHLANDGRLCWVKS